MGRNSKNAVTIYKMLTFSTNTVFIIIPIKVIIGKYYTHNLRGITYYV